MKARLWLEFDDGHKVELEYDGSYLFFEPSENWPNGNYMANWQPERLREKGWVLQLPESTPMKSYMIFGVCHPDKIILKKEENNGEG